MQPKSGKPEIDRQRLVELGAAVVEKTGGIGDRSRNAVADRIDRHRPVIEMAKMKKLKSKQASVAGKEGLLWAKPDIAPGVEIELAHSLGRSRISALETRGGEVARSAHYIVKVKSRRR